MDKTFISLLGLASALALVGFQAPAAASPLGEAGAILQPAAPFAELLDPVQNAGSAPLSAEKPIMVAEYYDHHHHHHYHHHHHHGYY